MRMSLVVLALAAALASGFLTSIWSASSADAGCIFDPNGRCTPAPQTDEGCIFDPDGRCNPTPQTDAGCRFDPNGSPWGS
jgi:hypothetical protein